jgi:hypothetical protein
MAFKRQFVMKEEGHIFPTDNRYFIYRYRNHNTVALFTLSDRFVDGFITTELIIMLLAKY